MLTPEHLRQVREAGRKLIEHYGEDHPLQLWVDFRAALSLLDSLPRGSWEAAADGFLEKMKYHVEQWPIKDVCRYVEKAKADYDDAMRNNGCAASGVDVTLMSRLAAEVRRLSEDLAEAVWARWCSEQELERLRSLPSESGEVGAVEAALQWAERPPVSRANTMRYNDADGPQILAAEVRRLRSLPAAPREDVSDYDRAVNALAPYLPDGWVAQDEDGDIYCYRYEPEDAMAQWLGGDLIAKVFDGIIAPRTPDWRTSLRRIEGGKVSAPPSTGGEG